MVDRDRFFVGIYPIFESIVNAKRIAPAEKPRGFGVQGHRRLRPWREVRTGGLETNVRVMRLASLIPIFPV